MNYGKFELMIDECSLSFYNIKENQRILLKNPHQDAQNMDIQNQYTGNEKKQYFRRQKENHAQ